MGNSSSLEGKVCLITGASGGIGREIAELFANEGAIVYAAARKVNIIETWADENNKSCENRIHPVYLDINAQNSVKSLYKIIKQEQGRLDVLVNNAGVVSNQLLGMISQDKLKEMFDTNVFGAMELTQLLATRFMIKQKSGSIINIASIVAVQGSKGQIAYSASKGAIISMTKSLGKELAPYNIRVNAVAPGMINTNRLKAEVKPEFKDNMPAVGMQRLGTPDDVAKACLFFASEMSSYVTEQILVVAGGMDTVMRGFYNIEFI